MSHNAKRQRRDKILAQAEGLGRTHTRKTRAKGPLYSHAPNKTGSRRSPPNAYCLMPNAYSATRNPRCTRLFLREYVKYTTSPMISHTISRIQFAGPSLYIM